MPADPTGTPADTLGAPDEVDARFEALAEDDLAGPNYLGEGGGDPNNPRNCRASIHHVRNGRASPSNAGNSRAGPSGTEDDNADPNTIGDNRANPYTTGDSRIAPHVAGDDPAASFAAGGERRNSREDRACHCSHDAEDGRAHATFNGKGL